MTCEIAQNAAQEKIISIAFHISRMLEVHEVSSQEKDRKTSNKSIFLINIKRGKTMVTAKNTKKSDKMSNDTVHDENLDLMIDPFEFLKNQHRDVERLFAELEATGDRAFKSRDLLFAELAQKIEAHTQLEEDIIYPAGKKIEKNLTLEAIEEHDIVRQLLMKTEKESTEDEGFMARIKVLKELVEHHVTEEENEYFPKLQKGLDSVELAELGTELSMQYEAASKKMARATGGTAATSMQKTHQEKSMPSMS